MSNQGESADPGQNGPADQPSELVDGGPRSLPPGLAACSEGLPRGAADSDLGSQSRSSEAWHRLLQAARDGCRESQAALFTAVRQKLVTFANQRIDRRFRSKVDGSDVVQQTLIDATCGIATFRGETRAELMAWLEGILIHRMADARRHFEGFEKRRVSREVPLDRAPAIPADDTSPSVRAMRHESHERLEQSLRQLPEPYEHILRLRNQLDMTLAEVATALGCSHEAASKRWARAVRRLRLELRRHESA